MQDHEVMQIQSSSPGFPAASQQEADVLAEALERWLDDGGASDDEAASDVGVGDCSPLPLV
ncbi:MAG TPA: hypothetical protein VIZ18_10020 [Ktedonobacteraceae bacterium]